MNETANNATPNLTWTSKPNMGVSTYHAEADGWKYTVDQPSKGRWVLRGWGPEDKFLYRDGFTTMKAAKAEAADHLAAWQPIAEMKKLVDPDAVAAATRVGTELAKIAPAMAKLGPVVDEAAATIARATALVRAARDRVQFRKDTCGCPTPLHTMRCGVGGRVLVRKAAA
ncbi:hypothetical protein SEA_XKCD426_54 [Streptomyces phage Xkcd426]|nr:hypothetical protein SEA_XKCD426_54 [Streptomyces phage Xkcd426]